jgi:DNA-binding HxlR family transcriptional regulator
MSVARRQYLSPILEALARGPATYNQLLKGLRLYPDTLNRAVRELKKAAVIEIAEDNQLGRLVKVYRLTPKGKVFLKKLKEVQRSITELEDMLKGASSSNR